MEILIIGGVLVALMVYASTRIKKSAASAYEAETIESAEFTLVKPEGFINPIGGDSEFAFEAYSKDFGESDATEKLYRAQATLQISENEDFAAYDERAKQSLGEIISAETLGAHAGGQKISLLKGETERAGAQTLVYRKIIGVGRRIYDLQAMVLSESSEEYGERIERLLESFRVK